MDGVICQYTFHISTLLVGGWGGNQVVVHQIKCLDFKSHWYSLGNHMAYLERNMLFRGTTVERNTRWYPKTTMF